MGALATRRIESGPAGPDSVMRLPPNTNAPTNSSAFRPAAS